VTFLEETAWDKKLSIRFWVSWNMNLFSLEKVSHVCSGITTSGNHYITMHVFSEESHCGKSQYGMTMHQHA